MAINCNELLDVQVVEGMSNFIFANDKFFRRISGKDNDNDNNNNSNNNKRTHYRKIVLNQG